MIWTISLSHFDFVLRSMLKMTTTLLNDQNLVIFQLHPYPARSWYFYLFFCTICSSTCSCFVFLYIFHLPFFLYLRSFDETTAHDHEDFLGTMVMVLDFPIKLKKNESKMNAGLRRSSMYQYKSFVFLDHLDLRS